MTQAQLVLDEELFLHAIKTLAELEDGGGPFALVDGVRDYSASAYIASRFAVEFDRDIDSDDQHAIAYYAAAVYLVHHHRASIEDLPDVLEDYEDTPELDYIRSAAWAFLSAWSLRYGGLYSWLTDGRGMVDPSRYDVSPARPS
jgi:hypothetical protein